MMAIRLLCQGLRAIAQASLLTHATAFGSIHQSSGHGSLPLDKRAVDGCSNSTRMPDGAWDSHLHVLDPDRFPPLPDAAYTPGVYTVWDNAIVEHRLGAEPPVMVQPSIYGYNNTLLLDSLKAYGPDRARAVVVFDADNTTASQLKEWDSLGVRGVRLNLITDGVTLPIDELKKTIQKYADAIRPLNWVLDLYFDMATLPDVEDFLSALDVRMVFDHFAHPKIPESEPPQPIDPYPLDGFTSLARLLQGGGAWVKISGAYRLSNLPGPNYGDMDPVILELFRIAPSRVIYASDWPHTQFEGLDIKPWTEHLIDLTGSDVSLRQKLFTDNPRGLWGTDESS